MPSLWFYGDNDSFFAPAVWRGMYGGDVGGGGHARIVAFGRFGNDSHTMFGSRSGTVICVGSRGLLSELGPPFTIQP